MGFLLRYQAFGSLFAGVEKGDRLLSYFATFTINSDLAARDFFILSSISNH
ncbi:hypothetical protein JYQ62_25380 [Nostoc sp. UHCC 0702]|nr:hypothetical protein JYQ62_25380 [Nostoc sp. UHCC 0702]